MELTLCTSGSTVAMPPRPGATPPVFLMAGCETYLAEVLAMETREWVAGRPAVRLSGHNIYMLYKLALTGRLRYRADPGQSVRFHRDDLVRLANGM